MVITDEWYSIESIDHVLLEDGLRRAQWKLTVHALAVAPTLLKDPA
jgi:hypothetical protein